MQWTDQIRRIKIVLVVAALMIAVASLLVSHFLVRDLSIEEHNRMEVWAQALHALNAADETTDLTLVLNVMEGNNTIPVIVMNEDGQMMESLNFDKMVSDFFGCIDPDGLKRLERQRDELGFFSITHTLHEIIMQHESCIDENQEYIKELFEDIRIPSGQAINEDVQYKRGYRRKP